MNKMIVCVLSFMFVVACSSKGEPPTTTSSSGGTPPGMTVSPPTPMDDAGPTATVAVDGGTTAPPPPNPTLASCIADCGMKYPAAAAKNKQLDATCFLGGACEPVCDNLTSGKLFEPSKVDGGGCNTAGAMSFPIATPSQVCSDCLNTNAACCAEWISIFSSVEGQALNTCSNTCYATNK
jgi:hypothetical protein